MNTDIHIPHVHLFFVDTGISLIIISRWNCFKSNKENRSDPIKTLQLSMFDESSTKLGDHLGSPHAAKEENLIKAKCEYYGNTRYV